MDNSVILVVDDEPLNLKLLRGILSDSGYAVLEAGNGREALTLADRNPDLILLDLMMPEIDGFETCRMLKENPDTREIPVIFLSALQDLKYKTFGARLGGADYITKPFDQEELLARVQTQLTISDQQTRLREYAARFQEINDPLAAILGVAERVSRDLAGSQEMLRKVPDSQRTNPISDLIGKLTVHLEEVSRGREKLDRILGDLKDLGKEGAA